MTCQICDLLFGIRDLLIAFGYLTPEILNLSLQSLILTLQLFTFGLVGVPMTIRRCLWLPGSASRSRTHPPYVKRFRLICPALNRHKDEKVRYNRIHTKLRSGERFPPN